MTRFQRGRGLRGSGLWALFLLVAGLLGWYVVYAARINRVLREDTQFLADVYTRVQDGVLDPGGGELQALFEIQDLIAGAGIPMVLTGRGDTVIAAVNTPVEADPATQRGQERLLRFARDLDARTPPRMGPEGTQIHYGDSSFVRSVSLTPWLQVGGFLLSVALGLVLFRYQRRAQSEQAWTAMARELAHQLGTPISSLQGWLEVLRLSPEERPPGLDDAEVARSIEEDLERLGRISHRFELIGRDADLTPLDLQEVVRSLEAYMNARLPRLGAEVRFENEFSDEIPTILGNEVLLMWALENIVNNSLDALAGRGGTIRFSTNQVESGWVRLRVHDTGSGVAPEVRDSLFEPGVTTKERGWGVGLALSRRIIEGVHGGRIELLDRWEGGTTLQIRLPAAPPEADETR